MYINFLLYFAICWFFHSCLHSRSSIHSFIRQYIYSFTQTCMDIIHIYVTSKLLANHWFERTFGETTSNHRVHQNEIWGRGCFRFCRIQIPVEARIPSADHLEKTCNTRKVDASFIGGLDGSYIIKISTMSLEPLLQFILYQPQDCILIWTTHQLLTPTRSFDHSGLQITIP